MNGESYIIWAWKWDYINLGAGAETGIYKKGIGDHYFTATDLAQKMQLNLKDSSNNTIFNYTPTEKQWWIKWKGALYMFKKIKIISLICVLSFLLGGCGIKDKIKLYFMSEFDKSNIECEKIIDAINTHDESAVEKLFSENTLEKVDDLEKGYEYLFDEYQGGTEKIKRIDYSSMTHYGNKFDLTREVCAEFLVTTKEKKYDFYVEYTIVEGRKSKDKGISKLVVKSFENEDKPVWKAYEKNGIYWPGWDEGGKEE